MKRNFSRQDIKLLIDEYTDIIEKMEGIPRLENIYQSEIEKNANAIVDSKVRKILEKVPIEELNRNKKGIRLKALKDAGITNVGQLVNNTFHTLAAIRGISEDTAYNIIREYETLKKTGIRRN